MQQIDRYCYFQKDYLGKGSFGKVYRGKDSKDQKSVAIKIMDMTQFHDEFMILSLQNEIKIMKELQHEHIVKLLDVFGDKKMTVMIIELCEGDLRNYIKQKGGKLEEVEAVSVITQLMDGFHEMIKRGYIHRDIKPENALYLNGCYKVADFGFATKADVSGKLTFKESVGTPLYMAPQLLQNQPYTVKSDIWSIGIMAYEMVYGKQPWCCRDRRSYLQNMKNQPLKFPVDRMISDEYQDFIKRCLQYQEDERISWDELFKHEILVQGERNYKKMNIKIDKESQQMLAQVQRIVQNRGLDVFEQFKKFDKDQGGSLDFSEFFQFLIELDSRLTGKEIKQLFDKIDENKDQTINIEEFKHIFCEYDYVNDDFAERIILDLKEIIKANQQDIKQIFRNFDTDQQGDLDIDEFSRMIQIIAPDIKDYDIKAIFNKFDSNGDSKINFEEFRNKLDYKQDYDTKLRVKDNLIQTFLSEFKEIVINNKIDIELIFRNFAKNLNTEMNYTEFSKLCSVIDRRLTQYERRQIFKFVNLCDRDGITLMIIQIQNFSTMLMTQANSLINLKREVFQINIRKQRNEEQFRQNRMNQIEQLFKETDYLQMMSTKIREKIEKNEKLNVDEFNAMTIKIYVELQKENNMNLLDIIDASIWMLKSVDETVYEDEGSDNPQMQWIINKMLNFSQGYDIANYQFGKQIIVYAAKFIKYWIITEDMYINEFYGAILETIYFLLNKQEPIFIKRGVAILYNLIQYDNGNLINKLYNVKIFGKSLVLSICNLLLLNYNMQIQADLWQIIMESFLKKNYDTISEYLSFEQLNGQQQLTFFQILRDNCLDSQCKNKKLFKIQLNLIDFILEYTQDHNDPKYKNYVSDLDHSDFSKFLEKNWLFHKQDSITCLAHNIQTHFEN